MTRVDPIQQAVNADIATIVDLDPTTLGRRLHAAIDRDRRHNATPDGYPTKTPGATAPTGSSRPCPGKISGVIEFGPLIREVQLACPNMTPCPEHDPHLTTVEAATHARTNHTHDEHRTLTRQATRALNQAATLIQTATHALNQQDKLRQHDGQSTEPGCTALDRIGAWEPVYRRTTIGDTTWALGEWAYKFLARTGELPTLDQCRQHARGQRVMTKPTNQPPGRTT